MTMSQNERDRLEMLDDRIRQLKAEIARLQHYERAWLLLEPALAELAKVLNRGGVLGAIEAARQEELS